MYTVGLLLVALEVLFLAVPLAIVGYGLNRLISRMLASRRESEMMAAARIAAARARSSASVR